MSDVIIGMDPHKHSATIEIIDSRERVLDHGRFATTTAGYRAMLAAGRRYPQRRWAIEGCNGIGRHIAQRLVADGVAVAALRSTGLREVAADDATVALRLLVDRRDTLGRTRTDLVNRLHVFLLDLIPGGAKKDLSARQARALLSTVEPTDLVGRTRHRLAGELVGEIETIDGKIKAADRQLTQLVKSSGSRVKALHGIGPSGAARLIGDIADITRFASRGHFAAWNGTAPLDASSGQQQRHRLSRAGNRRINRVLHIMAVVQLRHDTDGRRYYDRRLAEGKTSMEAMRALKRRLSDVVYKQMIADAKPAGTGPGGHPGATLTSSAASPIPTAGTSEQSLPGPARNHHRTDLAATP